MTISGLTLPTQVSILRIRLALVAFKVTSMGSDPAITLLASQQRTVFKYTIRACVEHIFNYMTN